MVRSPEFRFAETGLPTARLAQQLFSSVPASSPRSVSGTCFDFVLPSCGLYACRCSWIPLFAGFYLVSKSPNASLSSNRFPIMSQWNFRSHRYTLLDRSHRYTLCSIGLGGLMTTQVSSSTSSPPSLNPPPFSSKQGHPVGRRRRSLS